MQKWISSHSTGPHSVIQRLTKESVRMHHNVRNSKYSVAKSQWYLICSTEGDQSHASTSGHGASHTSDFAIPGVVIPGMSCHF